MKHRSRALLLIAAGVLSLPGVSRAQGRVFPPLDKSTETKETRPPIPPVPPGVPTTPDNVHLPTEGEVKLGREGSAEVEKQYKVVKSGPSYERLQRVSREVVQAIQRPEIIDEYKRVYHLPKEHDSRRRVPFEFSFKLVDATNEVNAFSLAGGPVYVTQGLMNAVGSDDELAAVLAHECSHVAFHHVEQLVNEQRKASKKQIWGMLAAVLAGAVGGPGVASAASNILVAGQLVQIATMSGYGRKLETEADRVGALAMVDSKYSPVAMLTFMQKLARDDRLRGNPDYGIFQSHPYSNERVAALEKQLQTLGFATDAGTQRKVSGSFRILMAQAHTAGRDVTELRLNGNLLFAVAAPEGDLSPEERAKKIARQLEDLFAGNISFNDVAQSTDKSTVFVKSLPVIRVLPEDAAVAGSMAAASDQAYKQIIRALWKEKLER